MGVFTCNNFKGFWPVGASAVVVADTESDAAKSLEKYLERMGLEQRVSPEQMVYLPTDQDIVRILNDGDY